MFAVKVFKAGCSTIPKANYPLVFRSQNSYRRSFLIWGNPKKTAFPSSFSLMLLSGVAPHFPKRITLLFSAPKILTAVFLIWGNPEKIAFPSSFSLMLLSGGDPPRSLLNSNLLKAGRPPPLPKQITLLRFPIKSLHRKKSVL